MGDREPKVAVGPAVVRADLGGLAHLLLKLSSHTIVLLDAQRKRLGRFLRLQLRLVRRKRKVMAFSLGLSFTNLKQRWIAQWLNGNNFLPDNYNYCIPYRVCIRETITAVYSQSGGLRAEQLGNVVVHNCQERINRISLSSVQQTLVPQEWTTRNKCMTAFKVTKNTLITWHARAYEENMDAGEWIQPIKFQFTSSSPQGVKRDTWSSYGLE